MPERAPPFRRQRGDRDHAAAPSGFARSTRSRSRGLFIASHRSLRRCTLSQDHSGRLRISRRYVRFRLTSTPFSDINCSLVLREENGVVARISIFWGAVTDVPPPSTCFFPVIHRRRS